MTITNRCNLPEPLVRAITYSNRDREGCDYTITELLRPPRQAVLERLHANEITEDASERIWALLGSAGHEVLRRSSSGGIVEERAVVEFTVGGRAFKVGGQLDYAVSDKALIDYKFTSVYAARDGVKPEWTAQLNCYRLLTSLYGVAIDSLSIVAIFRDWSKQKAQREPDYPQEQVAVLPVPLWSRDQTTAWICERIATQEAAKVLLPDCTDEETWAKPEKWAVMKKGAKRALKLHDTEQAATEHSLSAPGLTVERRPGERPRCESYCRVSDHCTQWQHWKANNP